MITRAGTLLEEDKSVRFPQKEADPTAEKAKSSPVENSFLRHNFSREEKYGAVLPFQRSLPPGGMSAKRSKPFPDRRGAKRSGLYFFIFRPRSRPQDLSQEKNPRRKFP